MTCQQCHKKEANVFFKGIIQNKVIQWNLCSGCAEEKGLPLGFSEPVLPIMKLLASLGGIGAAASLKGTRSLKCPECGFWYSQLQQTGRLGCSRCYRSFSEQLEPILRRIHGSSQHRGKRYLKTVPARTAPAGSEKERATNTAPRSATCPSVSRGGKELDRLREELKNAVQKEDYEKAAQIRDLIRNPEI